MEKTIKYLENGEYHYATVRSVGDLAQLKTDSKETLVEAINELWNGGGNADPSKAPKPEGYDQLVQDVADAVKNQQEISQQWIEWQNEEAQLTEERKQAYLQAMKEMQEAIDKAKADAAALDDKTTKLDEQITKTFSDLDTSIQNMHEQLQKEADRMNQELIDTKSDLTKVRTDLQNAQLDNGRIHDELTNINGKFEHKVWQTDLDPLKEQIDRAETSIQQTKDELLGKASREDLDTVTNAVSKLDTQLKETAKGVEISVKKDELSGDVARLLNDKTNLLLGTRNFSGEDNWKNRDAVTIEPGYYKGLKSVAVQVTDRSIYQPYHVKANTAYTFSFFGKEDKDNSKATLIIKPIDAPNINIDNAEQPVHITTEWQRFAVTFSADQDCDISIQIIQGPEASNNILHLAGFKLQYGQNNTPWEPNEADVAENIEHTESQFNVYSDQIAGIVKKQEKMGDTERQLDTRITETAEGLKQTSKDLQDANGKITEFKGQLESTARGLKTEYEKYTNDAVGQISDSTLNLIRNSSFQNKDEDFAQWQNISAKANIRQDENGLRWVELTQSDMTTDNIVGLTSNYFNIKQGKVTVAVDIKSGTKADLDIESVLTLELYDENKKRVDFYDVSLSQLGLSKELLGDHKVHRGLYRLGIDRNDAKYMTVKAKLVKNGDLYFTNFSARLSSIDDGAYEPNPDDLNQQILKQNTKIEQNAKEVAIKANSVDVTRDIKSAVDGIKVGGTNLAAGTNQEYTMGFGIPDTTWKDGFAYATLPTAGNGVEILPQEPHAFWYALTPGREYTQTIWFQTDATVKDLKAASITWFTSDGHDHQPATIQKIGPNSYKLFCSYKWPGKNNNDVRLFDISELRQAFDLNTGTYLKFGKLKLEEGNKSTSWSPAPEDTSAEIKSAKDAAIQVASDQINLRVNELSTQFDDKLNKRINEQKTASEKFTSDGIEQVVTKVTNVKGDVDRLGDTVNGVGSRNLLHNTSDQYRTLTGSDWFAKSTANDIYTSVANYHGGNQFTYAATITNPSNYPVRLVIYCYDKSKSKKLKTILGAPVSANQPNARVNVTTVMDTDTWWIRTNIETLQGNTPQISIQVKDERLVEGTVSSSWSPNPDDINQQITNTNKKIDTQTLDSANIDQMKTQGHYFVKNLTGNPIGGWVYVDVTGNNNDRIRQDVYQDNGTKHMYRRLFGNSWSDWEQGAYLSDVNNVKTEVTASVKNLGDRVTTEVNSITTRMSDQIANAVELVQKSDFSDGSKGSWTVQSIISATNPAPPAELGISGMKVIQSNVRDSYEDVWHSVTPGEKFNVDFWCAPSGIYDSSFGLVFYDANKRLVPNNQWLGVRTDHSGQWKHYTGEITAPGNSAFAKPWFQIDMPADYHNTSWLAKPHIRRQDPRVTEAIREVNTKWDVANGQIQGKVTATDINNILNGKGYATQSWAQTMFQMKSDSITLQAVRDNITNGIQNQVNDAKSQINSANGRIDETNEKIDKAKIGERNLAVGTNRGKTGWTIDPGNGQSTIDDSWVNDAMGVVFNNSKKSTSWWVVQYPFDMGRLKPNTFYTISFDIQTDIKTNGDGYLAFARGDSSGSPFVNSTSLKIITEPGATTHVVCKAKTKGSIENNGQAFYLNSNSLGQANWVKIFNLMIVEGTQSIAWAAAPEDEDVKQKGVNLLKSTAYWNPSDWNHISDNVWYDDNWTDNLGHKAYGRSNAWQGLGQTVYVTPGVYTWSAQIYLNGLDSNDYVYPYMGDSRYNGTVQVQDIRKPMLGVNDQDKWINYSATFYVKNAGNLCVHPELNRDHGTIHIGSQKLEHGMVATPWSPSPLDDKNATITLDSADINSMKTQGHYFVRNLANNPISGWVYVDVTGNNNDRLKQEVYQDNGYEHRSRRWTGSGWTEWTTDVNNKNVVSQINITPDQIKIASNKIVIDGNTDIHGDLRTDRVRLVGKQGLIDMTGDDGMRMANKNGSSILIGNGNIDLMYNNDFRMNIDSSMMTLLKKESALGQNNPIAIGSIGTSFYANDKRRGMQILYTPGKDDWSYRGADYLGIGYSLENQGAQGQRKIYDQLELYRQDTTINGHLKRKGIHVQDALHLSNGLQIYLENKDNNIQDPIKFIGSKYAASSQPEYTQPYLTLGYSNSTGNAGLGINWWELIPTGRINSSYSYMSAHGTDDDGGITVSWYSYGAWYGGRKAPSIVYRGSDGNRGNGGIVFYPYGEVCFWQGDFRSNFRWSGIKQTD